MQQLPAAARLYVGGVIAVASLILAMQLPQSTIDQPWLFAGLLLVSSVTSAYKVALPFTPAGSSISVTYAVDFMALLLLHPGETLVVAAASAWSQCTFRMSQRNPAYRTIFSMASLVITIQAAMAVYGWLGGVPGTVPTDLVALAQPLVGAAATYWIFNTVLVAVAVALSSDQRPAETWMKGFLWSAPSYFVGAAVAAAAAWGMRASVAWLLPLTLAPLYLTYRTYLVYVGRIDDERRHAEQMSELHLATIEALALAIDAKDQTGQNHIRRVQVFAAELARSLGMAENDVQGVRTAALLHDIGKLAVPEHILAKPSPLTSEEFQKIRIHPTVGAEIIGAVPFPYPVAPLILNHHERWDGGGYPSGLKEEEIPLGARILSTVDYFDALTSDRPYHKAMTDEGATDMLRQEAGKAFDPMVVESFIALLPRMREIAESPKVDGPRLAIAATPESGRDRLATGRRPSVFDDIALAHREIYALYQIAQTMGTRLGVADTMTLISSKLANLVPFSTCALFKYDEANDALTCRFATGIDAASIERLTLRSGQGLTGWVARNRRPLVNARPSADLEAVGSDTQTSLQSALVCPLIFGEQFIGTLNVYHTGAGHYRDDHLRLLDRVCEQAAAVIHNSIVFEQTQEDSLTDPLTGLPNTRFMFMHLARELARADRLKAEVSLLVVDLDEFKEINDTYGHHMGDLALREVADVLRAAIRPYDICVRYAGDEFIVVLSGCGRDEAERKRLELQESIARVSFEPVAGTPVPIAMSVGAAVFPHDGDTYEALLARADRRMYRDKGMRKSARPKPHAAIVAPVAVAPPADLQPGD